MSHEFEITLAARPASLPRLAGSAVLRAIARSQPHTRNLVTAYFDTAALDLRRCGVTLRMRHTTQGWLQSVKGVTDQPYLRHEREWECPDGVPDLHLARRAVRHMGLRWPRAATQVTKLFESRISRTTWDVQFGDGSEAEVAFDLGTLRTASPCPAEVPICEIEVELKRGRRKPLYELAFSLVHEIPGAHLLFRSKADRGYALACGVVAPPPRGRPLTIDPGWTTTQLVVRAAEDCLGQVQANVEGLRGEADPQYLHQMRIGVRRMRTLFLICRAAELAEVPPRLRSEIKWLWDMLGRSRDWDVLVESTWPRIALSSRAERDSAEAFAARITAERHASHDALRRMLDGKRFNQLLLALAWFFTLGEREGRHSRSLERLARRTLDRQHARVCRNGHRLTHASEHQRHRLRIEAKKLRYPAEFLQSLYKAGEGRTYLRKLTRLNDVLGELNDITVMQSITRKALDRLPARQAGVVRPLLQGYAAASSERLEDDLMEVWKIFAKAKPFWRKRKS